MFIPGSYNGKFLLPLRVAAVLLTGLTSLLLLENIALAQIQALRDSPKVLVDEVWQFVNRYYVDAKFNRVDWQVERTSLLSQTYTSPETAYDVIRAMLAKLNDPFTRFLPPQEYSQLLQQTTGGQLDVGLEITFKGHVLQVIRVVSDSPAAKAGVKAGDQILSINGRATDHMSLERATRMIRGMAGAPLVILLSRTGQKPFSVEILREGPVARTVSYQTRPLVGTTVGYIRLSGFNSDSAKQMSEAIAALKQQQVQGFILDLRDNPGGLLEPGLEIARMWLNRGVIVQILEREGKTRPVQANNSALTDLPLVVLVNQDSASASEILAGALQDNRRATVVGSRTFGKAMVQAVHELTDGSAIVLTVAHYYTPKGSDISQTGITPDVLLSPNATQDLELRLNPQLLGTSRDSTFARALEILATKVRVPLTRGEPAQRQ